MKLFLTSKMHEKMQYDINPSNIQSHNYRIRYFEGTESLLRCLKDLEYYQIVGIASNNSSLQCSGYIIYDNINYQGSYMIVD